MVAPSHTTFWNTRTARGSQTRTTQPRQRLFLRLRSSGTSLLLRELDIRARGIRIIGGQPDAAVRGQRSPPNPSGRADGNRKKRGSARSPLSTFGGIWNNIPKDTSMVKDLLQELVPLAGPLLSVVKLLIDRAKVNGDERTKLSEAADAISRAVDETQSYLQHLEHGGNRLEVKEQKLVELWQNAGFKLSLVAKTDKETDLVRKLRLKAQSWNYQHLWPDDKVKEAGIDFHTIQHELARLKRVKIS